MDWNGNARHGVPRNECSYGFPFHNDNDEYCHGMEMKHQAILSETAQGLNIGPSMERDSPSSYGCSQEKKKRTLTNNQLESLERSFQEGIKLEPERKMKLSRELGLEPRQIAVWFQNRRARWKARQMERSYEALKHDYDHISKEKQMLQEEVRKLERFIRDNVAGSKQVAMMISGNTNCMISGEDMAESTSDAMNITRSNKSQQGTNHHQCNPFFNVEEYNNPVSPPYWGFFP